MKRVYANLIGNWTDISDGFIGDAKATLYVEEQIQNLFEYDHVNVLYKDKKYRIHPSMIQIVTE